MEEWELEGGGREERDSRDRREKDVFGSSDLGSWVLGLAVWLLCPRDLDVLVFWCFGVLVFCSGVLMSWCVLVCLCVGSLLSIRSHKCRWRKIFPNM